MPTLRLPWEIVETTPGTSRDLLDGFETALAAAGGPRAEVQALVGRSLASYWAVALGVVDAPWDQVAAQREQDTGRALDVARTAGDRDLVVTALLGRLYARWGPDAMGERPGLMAELAPLVPAVEDDELRRRALEWGVVDRFDHGDLAGVRAAIARFVEPIATPTAMTGRRELLWRANLAMLEGRIDEAVALNQEAVSDTAHLAGTPFSFQNVAVTIAIERYLRRGLADVVEAARSIRASSPRVAANWDAGLCLSLAEAGEHGEAREIFDRLAADGFREVTRDLNWLVATFVLGQAAVRLGGPDGSATLLEQLRPFAHLDATHGAGYASYGPVGRVVGALAGTLGHDGEADAALTAVIGSRGQGPWTALTLLDRARVRVRSRPAEGLHDALGAAAALDELSLTGWADDAREISADLRAAGHGGPAAHLDGTTWSLTHPSGRAELPDGVGTRRLLRLLRRPAEATDVLDLEPDTAVAGSSAGAESAIDPPARRAYHRRLRDLDAKATASGLDAAEEAERRLLQGELSAAAYVASPAPEVERARLRVTRSIHRAIAKVADSDPTLGTHLRAAVHTGRRCSYEPVDGTAWIVTPAP